MTWYEEWWFRERVRRELLRRAAWLRDFTERFVRK